MNVVIKTNVCWCVYLLDPPYCMGFSLAVVSGNHSLVAVCGFLIDMASLVEHRL